MPQTVGQSSAAPKFAGIAAHFNAMPAHMKQNRCPHPTECLPTSGGIRNPASHKNRKRNDATRCFIALFLTHVGSLATVKSNQRRSAPTPAHITGIRSSRFVGAIRKSSAHFATGRNMRTNLRDTVADYALGFSQSYIACNHDTVVALRLVSRRRGISPSQAYACSRG
jgi:hypothetical protein